MAFSDMYTFYSVITLSVCLLIVVSTYIIFCSCCKKNLKLNKRIVFYKSADISDNSELAHCKIYSCHENKSPCTANITSSKTNKISYFNCFGKTRDSKEQSVPERLQISADGVLNKCSKTLSSQWYDIRKDSDTYSCISNESKYSFVSVLPLYGRTLSLAESYKSINSN